LPENKLKPPGDMIDIGECRLHCLRRGAGSPTVVFESGGGGGSSVQDWPVLNLVAPLTRCVAYDRAGLGWSNPPASPPTYDGMARDLDALLAAAGETPPFVLVGGSFGGLLALAYGRLFPDKVAGLVIVDASDPLKYFETMPRMRVLHEAELRSAIDAAARGDLRRDAEPAIRGARGLDEMTREAMLHTLGLPGHFEASLAELQAIDRATPEETAALEPGSLGDRPLIVLCHGKPGAMSAWEEGWAEAQARLAALSTRSAHLVAARNGHSIALENPGLVAACIAAVVGAVRGGGFDVAEARRLASRI
jgi:pimeloyl-ACP methyl ester carboxylesterase